MPTRTPEERTKIDSLAIIESDEHCNARTPTGYCKNIAGFKTDHHGLGRCKFHGGRAGRPVSHGRFSEVFKSDLKKEFDKMIEDPLLVDLYAELATVKTILSKLIEDIQEELQDPEKDFWTSVDAKGNEVESVKATFLLKYLDQSSKIYTRITDAESKGKNSLNIKQVMYFVSQIGAIMNESCTTCPVRAAITQRLKKMKSPILGGSDE